jgi:DNA-directed RNA polymerase subunit RPC12/RpoP
MAVICFLFGHLWAHDSLCKRCGKIRNDFHRWDECRCSHCGKVLHDSSIISWSYENQQYIFEKKCIKCGRKTASQERVPFGKMILGRPIQ